MSQVETIRAWLGARRPVAAIVLGSGLGPLADALAHSTRLPYRAIPGFPRPTVEGHAGELVAGELEGRVVLCQSGRFHLYEGHPCELVVTPIRLFAAVGIDTLLLTNAAGGIRVEPGSLMLLADHLNLGFRNPLTGAPRPGELRLPDMSCPYDLALRQLARGAAARAAVPLSEGVYAGLTGPCYETPAEVRMLRAMGADAVGMSTVQEVVAARALGMRCLGVSLITNRAAGLSPAPLSHAEVMLAARKGGAALEQVVRGTVGGLRGP